MKLLGGIYLVEHLFENKIHHSLHIFAFFTMYTIFGHTYSNNSIAEAKYGMVAEEGTFTPVVLGY